MERLDVYKKPRCVQCDATDRALTKHGLEQGSDYITHDVSEDEEAIKRLGELGHRQVPVLVISEVDPNTGESLEVIESISGFRPDILKRYAQQLFDRLPELSELGLTPQELHDRTSAPHYVS